MSEPLIVQLETKAKEAEEIERSPDPERDPGQSPDSVNEWGRVRAGGRASAFREAIAIVEKYGWYRDQHGNPL